VAVNWVVCEIINTSDGYKDDGLSLKFGGPWQSKSVKYGDELQWTWYCAISVSHRTVTRFQKLGRERQKVVRWHRTLSRLCLCLWSSIITVGDT